MVTSGEPERTRPPTIRDVAARAGVSKSLVSLVLRDAPHVRPDKRNAVLDAIRELGYRTNAAGRSLREARSRTVGVLLNDLRNPWFVDLLQGLSLPLHAGGLHMLLADARLARRAGGDVTETFLDLHVDGLVVVGTPADPSAIHHAAQRLPTVVAGTREPDLPTVDIVANDDESGARMATEHLINLGHRHVAHITGHGIVGDLRRASYEATMRDHGLADAVRIEPSDWTEEGGYRATVRLLSGEPRPTAIFAVNDTSCLGALSAAQELGIATPTQLSLIGYDNTYLAKIRHLWFDSVDNASYAVGRHAAIRLLDRMQHPTDQRHIELIAPRLEIRGSTSAPPPSAAKQVAG